MYIKFRKTSTIAVEKKKSHSVVLLPMHKFVYLHI